MPNMNINPLPSSSPIQYFDISSDQFSHELNSSNILRIGILSVQSIVHSSKQLNLFSLLFFHQLYRTPGVRIILHSSLAIYVIRKRYYKDCLIFLLLQLPGQQDIFIIGAYVPPSNRLNSRLISKCHFTLIF
ncbi:hypothetical protein GLOIN_2v1783829 [Rhizophagus irregularis DAOM 181602=DAOM 197198]|nr:hypothetical protein GLOIN_2v1783829 [Rhizophagus irregularis DAOM 181602=DAOM 197198]